LKIARGGEENHKKISAMGACLLDREFNAKPPEEEAVDNDANATDNLEVSA
jgi:hypothetical protein